MKPGGSPLLKENLSRVAVPIAHHFGFRPLEEVLKRKKAVLTDEEKIEKERRDQKERVPLAQPPMAPAILDPFAPDVEKLFSMLFARGHFPPHEPLFIFWHPVGGRAAFALGVIGTPLSVAEAILLKTAHTVLFESAKGPSEILVEIGSQGDRESSLRFGRDALNVIRKNEQELPREIRILARDDPHAAARTIHEKFPEIASRLPSPMDYLSDKSRTHLREVLEHLEGADIPYAMRSSQIGHPDWHNDTLFEISIAKKNPSELADTEENQFVTAARGGRYDEYAKRLARTRTSAALLFFPGKFARKDAVAFPKEKSPLAYFIHIGFEARVFGISLIDSLRPLRLPIRHSFGVAGFREQLQKAEDSKSPYAIIMGHKEALDHAVIIRDMSTRAQESVPFTALSKRLTTLNERRKR